MLKEHTIWNEKYRSKVLNNFVVKSDTREILQNYIDSKDIPHLLFHGAAGSGKTTIAKLLASNIECDNLFINASDESGIDNIRDKVKAFASAATFRSLKIIILDECDFLTINAQAALRNVIETFSRTTRFILTCNYIERVIEPLQSRCTIFKLESPTKREIAQHIIGILKAENVKYSNEEIVKIVNKYYPDIRRTINASQRFSIGGVLKISDELSFDYKEEIFKHLKNKDWKSIRQVIANNSLREFQDVYSFLYEKYFENPEIVCILAEYQYKQTFVVDREICFAAMCVRLIEVLK